MIQGAECASEAVTLNASHVESAHVFLSRQERRVRWLNAWEMLNA